MAFKRLVGITYGYFVPNGGIGRHIAETAKRFINPELCKILTLEQRFDNFDSVKVSFIGCKREPVFLSSEENTNFSEAINQIQKKQSLIIHSHGVYNIKPDLYTAHICLLNSFEIMIAIFGKQIVENFVPNFHKIVETEKRMLNTLKEEQIFSVSKKLSIDLSKNYGLDTVKMKIILNSSRFPLKKITYSYYENSITEIILGTIGSNFYAKGFPFVCKLIAELNRRGHKTKCIIAGCNERTISDLSFFIQQENISYISDSLILKGRIDIGEDFYSQLDCYLCLSFLESHSLSTLEAMSLGIPVISNSINSVFYDAKLDDPSLTLCEVQSLNNIQEMADAVEHIVLDSKYRDRLINSGFSIVSQTSWESVAAAYENLYVNLC
jgi:glycosyltransferase involved in cell wall biosynthesis